MKLTRLNANANILTTPSGAEVLFSYQTPVAIHWPGEPWIRTETFYSRTTSKHISAVAPGALTVSPQEFQENLSLLGVSA